MAWADLDLARQLWSDAVSIPDAVLQLHLDVATDTLTTYAPALAADAVDVPSRYQLACVYQAREQVNALLRDGADMINLGDYAVKARPLTAAVKQLLRPAKNRPGFGGLDRRPQVSP